MTPEVERQADEVREALRPKEQCRVCHEVPKRPEETKVCRQCELPACEECFCDSIVAERDEVCDECFKEVRMMSWSWPA